MEEVQAKFRALYRYIVFLLILTRYLFQGFLLSLKIKDPDELRRQYTHLGQKTIQICVRAFQINITVLNSPPENEVCLMVGNHLGFIDIMAVGSLFPTCFVTSKEMHETPVLGQLTEIAGCIYVERRKRANIMNELQDMATEMKKGLRVLLFPEATSTNGEQVLPFKKTLIMSAAYADCPIRPYVFNFKKVNGGPVEFKFRDKLCWYGDQTFAPALWRAFQLKSVDVEIEFLEPIYPKVDDDRSHIAHLAHKMIAAKYNAFQNPHRGFEALDQLNQA